MSKILSPSHMKRTSRLLEIIDTIDNIHSNLDDEELINNINEKNDFNIININNKFSNIEIQEKSHLAMNNANFPMADGKTMHLNIKKGDIYRRIISVGAYDRAKLISSYLDQNSLKIISSSRGFTTFSGLYNNVPVSIVATGMGLPMADFVAREARAVLEATPEEPMLLIRFGTCGTISKEYNVGTMAVATGSIRAMRNPDAFGKNGNNRPNYIINEPIDSDPELVSALLREMNATPELYNRVNPCLNCTADSFYSSQGRIDPNFDDRNDSLIDEIAAKYPQTGTLEMETFQLYLFLFFLLLF